MKSPPATLAASDPRNSVRQLMPEVPLAPCYHWRLSRACALSGSVTLNCSDPAPSSLLVSCSSSTPSSPRTFDPPSTRHCAASTSARSSAASATGSPSRCSWCTCTTCGGFRTASRRSCSRCAPSRDSRRAHSGAQRSTASARCRWRSSATRPARARSCSGPSPTLGRWPLPRASRSRSSAGPAGVPAARCSADSFPKSTASGPSASTSCS